MTAVRPFEISLSDDDISDLHERLDRTRWPDRETAPDWSQGVRLDVMVDLVAHWRDAYDVRRIQDRLNAFPQYLVEIDGLDIHFLHVRSPHPDAMPLILTHGWPSSVLDFVPLIGALTDPTAHGGDARDAFDVVIPSLPGFGFSGKPTTTGWDVARTARAWIELMRLLGYDRWTAHGGDWGAAVTTEIAARRPEALRGIHLSTPYVVPASLPADLTPEERAAVDGLAVYATALGGANHVQATSPETIGMALADSPVGQAAWILEKLQSKTDHSGSAIETLGIDEVLDTVSFYWFTRTAASSARIYAENRTATMSGPRLHIPVAVTTFPKDVPLMPRTWIAAAYENLIHDSRAAAGGHFAALEQPGILIEELRTGLRTLRGA